MGARPHPAVVTAAVVGAVVAAAVGIDVTTDVRWYVYMIRTDKNHLYTGIAKDVSKRLQEHLDIADGKTSAKGAKFFRSQRPEELVYTREFPDKSAALRHERLIKSMSALQKRQLVRTPSFVE